MLLVVAAGLAFMFGATRLAGGLLGIVLLFAVAGPFIEAAVLQAGSGVQLLLLVIVAIVVFRAFVILLIGRTTASHLAALLLHDLILAPFRFVRWLLNRRR